MAAQKAGTPAGTVCRPTRAGLLGDERADRGDDPDDPLARHPATERRAGVVPGYATPTLLARRSVFDRVGLLDESRWFSDATDWFLRAIDGGLVVELLPEPLVERHVHASNLTRRRARESADEFLDLVRERIAARRSR